jgi:hypothetical protein
VSGVIFLAIGILIIAAAAPLARANERWVAGNAIARRTTVLRGRSQRAATRLLVTLIGLGFAAAGVAVLASAG